MILTLTADVSCSEIIFMTVLIESRKNFPDNIKAARLDGGKTAASSSSPSPHALIHQLKIFSSNLCGTQRSYSGLFLNHTMYEAWKAAVNPETASCETQPLSI